MTRVGVYPDSTSRRRKATSRHIALRGGPQWWLIHSEFCAPVRREQATGIYIVDLQFCRTWDKVGLPRSLRAW